jgi:hypothetical protein
MFEALRGEIQNFRSELDDMVLRVESLERVTRIQEAAPPHQPDPAVIIGQESQSADVNAGYIAYLKEKDA